MPHKWNVTPKEAITIQKELRDSVALTPLAKNIRTIAGADVSLNRFEKDIYAGIIVLSYPELVPLEHSVVKSQTDFPYVPGLLSFREIPALIECYKKLAVKPDLILVDGQGIAHPRRLGIASHAGVLLDVPTIGVAKSRLYGSYSEPREVGESSIITDPKTGEHLGYAYKVKKNARPLIISPGHLVTRTESLEIVKMALRGYRLPEPTRQAHLLVNAFRKGEPLQGY